MKFIAIRKIIWQQQQQQQLRRRKQQQQMNSTWSWMNLENIREC